MKKKLHSTDLKLKQSKLKLKILWQTSKPMFRQPKKN